MPVTDGWNDSEAKPRRHAIDLLQILCQQDVGDSQLHIHSKKYSFEIHFTCYSRPQPAKEIVMRLRRIKTPAAVGRATGEEDSAHEREFPGTRILTLKDLDAELNRQPGKERLQYNGRSLRTGELRDLRDCYRRWCKIALAPNGDREQQFKAGRIVGLILGGWTLEVGDHLKVTHEEILPFPNQLLKDKEMCERIMQAFIDRVDGHRDERWTLFGRESGWNREVLCADFCHAIKRRMRAYRRKHAASRSRRRSHKPKAVRARPSTPSKVKAKATALKKSATG